MKQKTTLLILLTAIYLTACGGDNNSESSNSVNGNTNTPNENGDIISENPQGGDTETPVVIEELNLSTGSIQEPTAVFYDLDTESVVDITEEESESNQEWDIAFKRTKVSLNRFATTPVSLYFTGNTSDFYAEDGSPIVERFVNATPATELDAFVSTDVTIPNESEFHSDLGEDAIDNWYIYNFSDHSVTANDEMLFIVDSDSAMTKFRVTNLVQNAFGLDSITLGVSYQATGESLFEAEQNITIDAATSCIDTNAVYIDFDTLAAVLEQDAWDITLPCDETNLISLSISIAEDALAINDPEQTDRDGVSEEAAPYLSWVSNTDDVTYAYVEYGDENSGYGWGNYGVNGGHYLWSNYATYIIKTSSAHYKFQITSYYDSDTSASGSYSFRYIEIEE